MSNSHALNTLRSSVFRHYVSLAAMYTYTSYKCAHDGYPGAVSGIYSENTPSFNIWSWHSQQISTCTNYCPLGNSSKQCKLHESLLKAFPSTRSMCLSTLVRFPNYSKPLLKFSRNNHNVANSS